jgi:rubrerythrin
MRDNDGTGTQQEVCKFLVNLMDVLERQMSDSENPTGDLISRQAVENITWEEPSYTDPLNVLTEVREKVRALPSVENKGEWIEESDNYGHSSYFCSRCGTQEGKPSDICPNCRARMSNSEKVRNE